MQLPNLVAPMVALQSPDIACDFVMKITGQGEIVVPVTRDLAKVISAWPKLSPALQAAVLAIVESANREFDRSRATMR